MKNKILEIYDLANSCGVSKSEVNEVIELLGDRDATTYTQFFAETFLPKKLYLEGVKSIIEKKVDLSELRKLVKKKTELESFVGETVKKFNFTSKQLKQKGYRERVSDSSHYFEHLDSRLDRED